MRVLIVEDVPELSRLLEMTFELDERFTPIGTATDADTAVSLAATHQPEAVVLDMSIDRGEDGKEALPALRALLPDARIVVFTGHDDERRRQEAMASGASAYVVKGGDLDALLDTLAAG